MPTTSTIQSAASLIRESQTGGLLLDSPGLTGYSGTRLMGTLQRLARLHADKDQCYLEVGVFQGLTLLSVANAIRDRGQAYGIDNFAFFDPENKNFDLVKARREQLGLSNAHLINRDYEDALHSLPEHIGDRKIGVYFVDGPHDYRSQLVCLLFALPYLADDAIIVIDDCNYRHVRQANADFLRSHPEFKLLFEAYTPAHPDNMTDRQLEAARNGWWDGVNILVRDPNNELPQNFPPTHRHRGLYENEHKIHSSRFPEAALLGVRLAEEYARKNLAKVATVNRKLAGLSSGETPDFAHTNTYSAQLTGFSLYAE